MTQLKTINFDGILREFTGHPHRPHYTIYENRSMWGGYTDWNVYFHVPAQAGFGTSYYLGRGFTKAEAQALRDAHQAQQEGNR